MLRAAVAAAAPPGSYQQSCSDVQVLSGNTLFAICTMRSGFPSPTWLADYVTCVGDISNYDGHLECSRGAPPPGGSYTQSCRDLFMSGTTLSASCQTESGAWTETQLHGTDQCVGDIANYNGVLECDKGGVPPQGSYTASCRNIWVAGGTLHARCTTIAGGTIESTLPAYASCTTSIANTDGHLACDHGGTAPAGSYRKSCWDIFVSGPIMNAVCENMNGAPQSSALDLRVKCRAPVLNVDGFLTCDSGDAASPGGSWHVTCRNAVMHRGVLSALCKTISGQWKPSEVDTAKCASTVRNDDGTLKCDAVQQACGGLWQSCCNGACPHGTASTRLTCGGNVCVRCGASSGDPCCVESPRCGDHLACIANPGYAPSCQSTAP